MQKVEHLREFRKTVSISPPGHNMKPDVFVFQIKNEQDGEKYLKFVMGVRKLLDFYLDGKKKHEAWWKIWNTAINRDSYPDPLEVHTPPEMGEYYERKKREFFTD